MLNYDKLEIGNRLHAFRKKAGLTQAEAAEAAGLSDRAYAEIERGLSNMRTETLLNICRVLRITPNDLLLFSNDAVPTPEELLAMLYRCSPAERETAGRLLQVYLESLR